MDWADIVIEVSKKEADVAQDIATGISGSGLYIEDYSDMEQQVMDMAHVDLIDEELLNKPKDKVRIHLYLSEKNQIAPVVQLLEQRLTAQSLTFNVVVDNIQQEDWETAWKQYYKPIDIGKKLAIVPSWQTYKTNRNILWMDPGMAFGTGSHETTSLCLEVLDERIKGGETVLDIGTGSGILGIAALLLGAKKVDAIDIDPLAIRMATENAERNHVQNKMNIQQGNLTDKINGKYDLITANIIASAIIELAPATIPLLKENGYFLASGIIDEREQEVIDCTDKLSLNIVEIYRKNGWSAILFKK